mgnify:CR=1 FL=1
MKLFKFNQMTGIIKHRILLNYKIDAEVMTQNSPAGFTPKLVNGYAVGGICQVSLKQMRPAGFPASIGLTSHNAAHRVAVVNSEGDEGVLVLRRDTNSKANVLVGGRIFAGVYTKAHFDVYNDADDYEVTITRKKVRDQGVEGGNNTVMHIQGQIKKSLPLNSIFRDVEDVSQFFKAGNRGWSPQCQNSCVYDEVELKTQTWNMQPLEVKSHYSGYFMNETMFPKGSVKFDHAIIMRDIEHSWVVN